MMKAAAVSMVKNECDIIELFIKINLRTFDHLYIVDHDSSDGTSIILDRMKKAGHPITIIQLKSIQQSQAETITRVVRDIANTDEYDYIVPLDADEFLTPGESWRWELLDETLANRSYGLIPWKTFVPVSADFFGVTAPLHSNFRMRSCEPAQYHKVIVPNNIAKSCSIDPGNHALSNATLKPSAVEVPLELLHVPVRSSCQIIQKAILGSHTLSIKRDRIEGEGFHWDVMAKEIRAKNYRLSDDDLLQFALEYAVGSSADRVAVGDHSHRVGLPTDVIEHIDQARIDPIAAFDAFLAKTCTEINSLNRIIEAMSEKKGPLRSMMSRIGLGGALLP